MGVPAQPPLTAARRVRGPGRRGLALPSAMFALVAIAVLLGGIFVFADLNAKAVENRERATRATHVAEAGINHALGLLRGSLRMHGFTRILRGSDNLTGTLLTSADDSLFINWTGLSAQDQIPLAGQTYQGHTYFVTVADDPADTDGNPKADMNGRVRLWCRAVTTEGATAEVMAIVGSVPQPGVAADGNVNFSGTPHILGACGSAHSNGNIFGGGTPVVAINATATGTAGGSFKLPDGTNAPELGGQPQVVIPDLAPLNFCAGADYRLRADGFVVPAATGIPENATSTEKYGWKRSGTSPVKWDLSGVAVPGTFCVEGNAYIASNPGTAATPLRMSVIATGSIEVSGNPYLTADHDDGIMFLAGGDLAISGNPTAGSTTFSGLLYAGAQCKTSGNPAIFGQLMCANGAQPAGSVDIVAAHDFSGNFTLTYDCSGNVFNKRRVLFWYPRIGT